MRNPAAALLIAAALTLLSPWPLTAQQPAGSIDPPPGSRVLLQVKGEGAQIYTCSTTQDGVKWVLKAPDARLLDSAGKVIGRHFAGPTWQLSEGGKIKGQVQGELVASKPSPDSGSAAWLLLRAKAGSGSLARVAFIRRSQTSGGAAPASGCAAPSDAGMSDRVPYTAAYTFYSAP